MLNRDIYSTAPKENRLANNGVAEVSEDYSEAAAAVLRYELETFVCDGQYEKGLETILDKFLRNLDSKTEQPGVWISGFYGSGKSHLAKMLRILWTDYSFPDGAAARSIAKLPTGVFEHLKEVSTQGKRHGGLHAAAGKLGRAPATGCVWRCSESFSSPRGCPSNTTRPSSYCGSSAKDCWRQWKLS